MILGNVCTRNCGFCGVKSGNPDPPDHGEPSRVAETARMMNLKHIVITSVTRDDLTDGGSSQFARTVRELHRILPEATVETLIPDFQGRKECLYRVLEQEVDILNHNLETVPRLYSRVRPQADFERSLEVLERVKEFDADMITKSGLMVGLGETAEEVEEVFSRLAGSGCDVLTIGQYLSPSADHLPVSEYVHPEDFEDYKDKAVAAGIPWVHSGPFVRSSFNAEELMRQIKESRCE
jgi:lipoic acid synthetase